MKRLTLFLLTTAVIGTSHFAESAQRNGNRLPSATPFSGRTASSHGGNTGLQNLNARREENNNEIPELLTPGVRRDLQRDSSVEASRLSIGTTAPVQSGPTRQQLSVVRESSQDDARSQDLSVAPEQTSQALVAASSTPTSSESNALAIAGSFGAGAALTGLLTTQTYTGFTAVKRVTDLGVFSVKLALVGGAAYGIDRVLSQYSKKYDLVREGVIEGCTMLFDKLKSRLPAPSQATTTPSTTATSSVGFAASIANSRLGAFAARRRRAVGRLVHAIADVITGNE